MVMVKWIMKSSWRWWHRSNRSVCVYTWSSFSIVFYHCHLHCMRTNELKPTAPNSGVDLIAAAAALWTMNDPSATSVWNQRETTRVVHCRDLLWKRQLILLSMFLWCGETWVCSVGCCCSRDINFCLLIFICYNKCHYAWLCERGEREMVCGSVLLQLEDWWCSFHADCYEFSKLIDLIRNIFSFLHLVIWGETDL